MQPVAILERKPPCVADGEDGAHQVLIVAHAPGDAMHDQPQPLLGHCALPKA